MFSNMCLEATTPGSIIVDTASLPRNVLYIPYTEHIYYKYKALDYKRKYL